MVGRILVQSPSLREAEKENRAPVRGETLLKHLDAEWESNLRIRVSYTSVEISRKFWSAGIVIFLEISTFSGYVFPKSALFFLSGDTRVTKAKR